MKDKFLTLFNLKPGEWKLVTSLMLLLAINMMVLELSDVVATAGFISNVGVSQIPWLWLVTTTVTLFSAGGYAIVVDSFPRLHLISWLFVGLAIIYLVLQVLFTYGAPAWLIYPLLYILADQQWVIMPLSLWALANDVYTMSESKRLFPIIGTGVVLGSVLGNALAAASAVILDRQGGNISQLFVLAALMLLVGLIQLRLTFRKRPLRERQSVQRDINLRETLNVGLDYFKNVPLFRNLAILMPLVGLALTIVEFHFLSTIDKSFTTDLMFQTFYGTYKIVQTGSLLALQWLVTGRLMAKIPIKNAFLVLPAIMMAAAASALALPGLTGAVVGRFIARLTQRAWDEPARKTVQNLVPDERRGRISTFLDSYFYAVATIFGSLLLGILMWVGSSGWLSGEQVVNIYLTVAGVAAVGAVLGGWLFRSVYDKSLLNWRLSRSRRKSVLDNIQF